jgi:uncharacterized protein HemY
MLGCFDPQKTQEAGLSDVVNLNKFKKAKQKQAKVQKARENRILHGLSGAEKAAARAEADRAQVHLEKKRLKRPSAIKTVDDSE